MSRSPDLHHQVMWNRLISIVEEQALTLVDTEAAPIVEIAVLGGQSASARDAFARHVLMPELARLPGDR